MFVLLPCLLLGALGQRTPVDRAVTLLTNLQTQVQTDGAAEATQYDKFACFCKRKQTETAGRIETTIGEIASLRADLASEQEEAEKQHTEMQRLELLGDTLQRELKDSMNQRENERATHVA